VSVTLDSGSMHPTVAGQNLGYAHSFAAAGLAALNRVGSAQ
jgi:hypothetical protein